MDGCLLPSVSVCSDENVHCSRVFYGSADCRCSGLAGNKTESVTSTSSREELCVKRYLLILLVAHTITLVVNFIRHYRSALWW